MKGWFQKQLNVDDGIVLLSTSWALTTVKFIGANRVAEALAAFRTAYVAMRSTAYGASPALIRSDRIWQAAWHVLAIGSEYSRERLPPFGVNYVTGSKALETDSPNARFFDKRAEIVGWDCDRGICIEWMCTTRISIDETLESKSREWKA